MIQTLYWSQQRKQKKEEIKPTRECWWEYVCVWVRPNVDDDDNEKKWHGNVERIVYNEIETLE